MKSCHLPQMWMDLKGVMLSEINQINKHKYCMISLLYMEYKSEINKI